MPLVSQKNQPGSLHFLLLIAVFLLSRCIFYYAGIWFDFTPLTSYWQYLDTWSLQHNLLQALWYQSAQPPLFNLFLGALLKLSPGYPSLIFPLIFMMISMINAALLLKIIAIISRNLKLATGVSIIYLLAPATVLLENELFYTGFVSMLFLVSALLLLKWIETRRSLYSFFFFLMLAMICLTKSFYHLAWMGLVALLLSIKFFPGIPVRKAAIAAAFPLFLVAGWYGKNYYLFRNFSASSWVGMNLARLVYHDKVVIDSSSIASVPPFFPVSSYTRFIDPAIDSLEKRNGLVLNKEFKQGRDINMFNAQYSRISRLYLQAAKEEIAKHPGTYLKNVSTAGLIFFTPASSYFKVQENEKKMKYYDAAGSLNFNSFFTEKSHQKKSLAISSLVMMLFYAVSIAHHIRISKDPGNFSSLNYFILITIFYSLLVSSFFEYGDNMRFRYEIQPLFLVLLAQYFQALLNRRKRLE